MIEDRMRILENVAKDFLREMGDKFIKDIKADHEYQELLDALIRMLS